MINDFILRIVNVFRSRSAKANDARGNFDDADRFSSKLLSEQIPYYLTKEAKDGLLKALKDFPKNVNYYTILHKDDVLQGDAWTKFQLFNFHTGERSAVRGIILSNTCDIDPGNKRDLPYNIVFSPIIRLSDYEKLLIASKIGYDRVTQKLSDIRTQKITNIFYLPNGGMLQDEYIALLDNIHSIPAEAFSKIEGKSKLVALSQVGFYLFLFKISVHFCRFHENVDRGSPSPDA